MKERKEERKRKIKIRYLVLAVCFLVIICVVSSIFIDRTNIKVNNVTISIAELPDEWVGYRILQLSDLHSAVFGNNNDDVIEKIQKQDPDIIAMTGDMVNATDEDFHVVLNLIDALDGAYPIFYIYGNHEMDLKNRLPNLVEELKKRNVHVLDNEKLELTKGKEKINLYGLNYELKYYPYKNAKHVLTEQIIESKIGKADKAQVNILLTHNPRYFEVYKEWGADLTLTGHTHGGVFRIPFVGGIISPERTLFPKYIEGQYQIEDSYMLVNRGIGFGRIPVRIFNMPEMLLITLEK